MLQYLLRLSAYCASALIALWGLLLSGVYCVLEFIVRRACCDPAFCRGCQDLFCHVNCTTSVARVRGRFSGGGGIALQRELHYAVTGMRGCIEAVVGKRSRRCGIAHALRNSSGAYHMPARIAGRRCLKCYRLLETRFKIIFSMYSI